MRYLPILLWLVLFSSPLSYGEEAEREFHGQVTLMGKGIDNEGSKLKVGEYRLLESGSDPEGGFSFQGHSSKNYFNVQGLRINERDQSYAARFDLSRILRLDTSYQGLIHRLDHDPLSNLEFGTSGGLGSMSLTDAAPGERNRILRHEGEGRLTVRLPFLRRVRLISEYQEMGERGDQQANTIGHCFSCHVDSFPQRIHQRSREWSVGPEASLGPLTLTYLFRRRTFDELGKAPTAVYPNVFPTIFEVRGRQPFASIPDTERDTHQLGARLDLRQASFTATYVDGTTENRHTDRQVGVASLNLRGTVTPWRTLSIVAQYRSVDRSSTVPRNIDRDLDTVKTEITYRIGRGTILTGGYEHEEIERTNFPLDRLLSSGTLPGSSAPADDFLRRDTHTRTDRYRIRLSTRPFRQLSAKLGYRREHNDRPFTRFGKQGGDIGAFAGVQKVPWPFPDLTRLPEDMQEVFASLHWSIRSNLSLSADYRFIMDENNHVDRERESHLLTSTLWYTPIQNFSLTATYTFGATNINSNLQYGTSSFIILNEGRVITPMIDNNVLYENDIHNLSLRMELALSPKFSLYSSLRFTNSNAAYETDDISPDIEGFSNLNIGQTNLSVGLSYFLNKALAFYWGYSFDDYDDKEFTQNRGKVHEANFGFQWRF